uniref:Mitochondrial ribosomal protein S17 n=1 Tax=Panagrellus redivivus TaxID=6233 RepID=A0A7E4UPM7_PANRE
MAAAAVKDLLLGKVVQINKIGVKQIPTALVRCQENVFSPYIKKYFAQSSDHWALDSHDTCQVGDHVLIRRAERHARPTSTVGYNVERVVFQFGNLIDPITKKRVLNGQLYEEGTLLQKDLVKEVVEKPFETDSLLFDERRVAQKEKLEEKKSNASS